jgi:hypothetical protein
MHRPPSLCRYRMGFTIPPRLHSHFGQDVHSPLPGSPPLTKFM